MGAECSTVTGDDPQTLEHGVDLGQELRHLLLLLGDAGVITLDPNHVETQGLWQAVVVGDKIAPGAPRACQLPQALDDVPLRHRAREQSGQVPDGGLALDLH